MMKQTTSLSAIMAAHNLTKEQTAKILFPEMTEVGRTRKVERLMRGEQTLNADELITLAAYLLVTPNDLYLPNFIEPVKQIKTIRVLEIAKQKLDKLKNEKPKDDDN